MIDFHTHILPGIDDGSQSVEESLEMLRMERRQGIDRVVLTPHFYPRYDQPKKFIERRDRAEELLRQAMADEPDMPEIEVGAEVYYFRGISDSDFLQQLTIRGKSCIMIEMPDSPWPDTAYEELRQIYHRWGIVPIIAHLDRYIRPWHTNRIPEKLAQTPVLVQANASFFLNKNTSRMALRLLSQDRIHLLGSDCHNITVRKPNLEQAHSVICKRLGQDTLARISLFESNALQLI